MVITEINLKELIEQYDMAPNNSYDTFSITLHLNRVIRRYNFPEGQVITYGDKIDDSNTVEDIISSDYILDPGQAILACSQERIKMPKGYLGLLQTKGSLARLFVTVHCCDAQIEPGFDGCVTFEICNLGPLSVRVLPESPVAQMFIFKTSADKTVYNGKYNNSEKPTYSNN